MVRVCFLSRVWVGLWLVLIFKSYGALSYPWPYAVPSSYQPNLFTSISIGYIGSNFRCIHWRWEQFVPSYTRGLLIGVRSFISSLTGLTFIFRFSSQFETSIWLIIVFLLSFLFFILLLYLGSLSICWLCRVLHELPHCIDTVDIATWNTLTHDYWLSRLSVFLFLCILYYIQEKSLCAP